MIKPTQQVKLSVIVPARNEEHDISFAIQTILRQNDVESEIIIVNDNSSDQTGLIVDAIACTNSNVTVIHNPELRSGWLGKANAMQHAADIATGDYLLFTDADVRHSPNCFQTALAEMEQQRLDFLSFFPTIQCVSFWENANLPIYVGGLIQLAGNSTADSCRTDAIAAGALLLIRAEVFRAIGGWEEIRMEMFDDVAMARLVKKRGGRVGFHAAPDLLNVRLFKGNRDAFWGTTKNILAGLRGRLWLTPLVMLLPFLVFWSPFFAVVIGVISGSLVLILAGLVTYAIQYCSLLIGRELFSFHRGKALFFPFVAVVVLCCFLRALYYFMVHGSILWRDRVVYVRESTIA
ncbi:MAG: glycosyltransferase family 2 protein [Gemmataceae bacterium]